MGDSVMPVRRHLVCFISIIAVSLIAADSPEKEPMFHKALKQAAADYLSWSRVDDEMRWSPELCRIPFPGRAYASESKDEKTHGRKLYSLFAKDRKGYLNMTEEKPANIGQVIVKQSWIPEEVTGSQADELRKVTHNQELAFSKETIVTPRPGAKDDAFGGGRDHFYPYVIKGDKVFKASKQADLFIMMKLAPETPDTDQGWVYGTVTSDGKTVTAAGKIASCMKCHVDAKNDRLFGLPK